MNKQPSQQLNDLFAAKTKQWTDAEVIVINGIKCCYTTVKSQGYLVHMPGGSKRYAHELLFDESKKWVDLTYDQKMDLKENNDWYNFPSDLIEATEKKVKELNHDN